MRKQQITLHFEGGDADEHRLPSLTAANALYGMSRSLLISTNFFSDGTVKSKSFSQERFRVDLVAQKEGSFEYIFEISLSDDALYYIGGFATSLAASATWSFISSVFNRATGGDASKEIEKLEKNEKLNAVDVQRVVERINNPLKIFHNVINNGSIEVNINSSVSDGEPVIFNSDTKSYVSDSNKNNIVRTKGFYVTSYVVSSRGGRVFDFESGRSIAFSVDRGADLTTLSSVLESISNTAYRSFGRQRENIIYLKYRSIDTRNGAAKKIIIDKARSSYEEL